MPGRTYDVTLADGQRYELLYDLNALALIGEKHGIEFALDTLGEDLFQRKYPLSFPRTVLWAGLRHKHPDMTEEQVGALVTHENMADVMQGFFGLLGAMFSGERVKEITDALKSLDVTGGPAPAAPGATGKKSGNTPSVSVDLTPTASGA